MPYGDFIPTSLVPRNPRHAGLSYVTLLTLAASTQPETRRIHLYLWRHEIQS